MVPFQCLAPLGTTGLLCASRGSSIFVFSSDGSVLSSWRHPKTAEAELKEDQPKASEAAADEQEDPPSKKRKLDTSQKGERAEEQQQQIGKKGKQNKRAANASLEVPFVILLRATSDGKHVVVVTGQDKCVWVFEHDGQGQLKERSQRPMSKRPCDVAITKDGSSLLVADKFGDVYWLPLIPSSDPINNNTTKSQTAGPVLESKGANHLTVHSQRNLRALEEQIRQREKRQQGKTKDDETSKKDPAGPEFQHELLLGHVSMLTAVTAASSSEGKQYILTADRDEHIRVSRGMPQAHVIEHFCLGHTSFINAMCLLPGKSNVLVSGGGDDALFVWDWTSGVLQGTVDLLGHVRSVLPDASKIAVTKLVPVGETGQIVAICERVLALFIINLQAQNPSQSTIQTVSLPGSALDVTALAHQPQRIAASIDSKDGEASLLALERNGDTWSPSSSFAYQEPTADSALDAMTREELDKALYTVENLRKSGHEDEEAGDETPAKAPESAAVSS